MWTCASLLVSHFLIAHFKTIKIHIYFTQPFTEWKTRHTNNVWLVKLCEGSPAEVVRLPIPAVLNQIEGPVPRPGARSLPWPWCPTLTVARSAQALLVPFIGFLLADCEANSPPDSRFPLQNSPSLYVPKCKVKVSYHWICLSSSILTFPFFSFTTR